jgi:hypothetical protein
MALPSGATTSWSPQDGIWRVPHIVGALRAGRPVPPQRADQVPPDQRKPVPGAYGAEMLTKKGVFGIVQGHQNRHLVIDPKKTGALYVGVGSAGNLGIEPEPKATIQRFDADGSNPATVASGTRNPTALALHPDTSELWALVQERDGLRRQPAFRLFDSRAARRGSMAGPTPISASTRNPASAASPPTRSKRRSRPISCSPRTPHCSTSSSTRATSFRRNTKAACSSR